MSSIISSSSSAYLQSLLSTALQNTGAATKTTGSSGASSLALQADGQQLSPFAQLMSTLQQLQQSDPAKYQQVTAQIATNLQSAAQTAQANGNSTQASMLNQLATDFTSASKNDQLPNIQDLAQSLGAQHHHHHRSHHAPASSDSTANQATQTQNDALNPMTIILNTLSSDGVGVSNG